MDNFNLSSLDMVPPSPSPPQALSSMVVDSSRSDECSGDYKVAPPHLRSLSVDADFFDGLSFGGGLDGGDRKVGGHRRTNSMDGGTCSSSMVFEEEFVLVDGVKKAMPLERLAELALIDPKRAKRILANRQSAARSKERKIRYTCELERRVHTLQTEATTLSAQVTLLQRDTTGLTIENKELKLRLQALEQQAQLRDALNETLRQEVQRLRLATGQIPPSSNSSSEMGIFAKFPQNASSFVGSQDQSHTQPFPQAMHHQQQFQMADKAAICNSGALRQLKPNFMDFNHKG